MQKRHLFFPAFIAVILAAAPASASPPKDEDIAFWMITDLEHKQPAWTLRAGEEVRFNEHQGISYYDTHVGGAWHLKKWMSLGAEYLQARQTRTSSGKSIWFWEERPRIYTIFSRTVYEFKFETRQMLEFRFKESAENTVRYRPQLSVTSPWEITPLKLQPYSTGELFLESNRNGVSEFRLYGGLKYKLGSRLSGSLFYVREPIKNNAGGWKDTNVFGTTVKISV